MSVNATSARNPAQGAGDWFHTNNHAPDFDILSTPFIQVSYFWTTENEK